MSVRQESERLRQEIAVADLEILRAFENRAKLSKELSKTAGGSATGVWQESERLSALLQAATEHVPPESLRLVFRSIFAAMRSLERPTRVAYAGAEGTLGWVAALQMFGASVQGVGFETVPQALDEAARARVDYALAPLESSVEGPIMATVFALRQTDLMIVGQRQLPSAIALLSRTGNMADIEKIYATPQDRLSCSGFLNAKLPAVSVIDVRSPLVACQFAAEDHGGAAFAHEAAGDHHHLNVVLPNVADLPDLWVRFATIGTRPLPRTGQDMTSIIFTVNDEPGALLGAISQFAERGINITNVISRPVPSERHDHLFFLEFRGHITDRPIIAALDVLKKNTRFLRVLGSYPAQG